MIELFEQQLRLPERHSSKGNQLKWENEGVWYKADHTGYEGLAEYVISELLKRSSLGEKEYVCYEPEQIRYKNRILLGAKSRNMLTDDWQIITLERLFKNRFGHSLHTAVWSIGGAPERLKFLCEQTVRITGLKDFGPYMAKLLTIDAFFKNEDRHTHNIAVLMNAKGEYKLCPVFDNGAALLADTETDYPMEADVYALLDEVRAKTVSTDFDEQLEAAEALYGRQLTFHFTKQDVDDILQNANVYGEKERERVRSVLYWQMRKYAYLFR